MKVKSQKSKVKITTQNSKLHPEGVIASVSEAISSIGLPRLLRSLAMTIQKRKAYAYRFFMLSFLFIVGIGFISYKVTHALFSDSAQSQDNTFSAAEVFPTTSPTATPTPTSTPTPTPIPTPAPGDVVINEIMWSGSSMSSLDEWIELRNMTGNTIDLSSWVVENLGTGSGSSANITIPSGKSIGPNGFFLISNDPKETSVIDIDPDLQTTTLSLSNGGEELILKNNLGTVIDTANQDDDWFAGSSGSPKKSMERNNVPSDGTVSTNWHTATSATNIDGGASDVATPKAANSL